LGLDKKPDDPSALDFQAFEQLIVQVSLLMFSRPPRDLRGHPVN
jgi:hypothetical protein